MKKTTTADDDDDDDHNDLFGHRVYYYLDQIFFLMRLFCFVFDFVFWFDCQYFSSQLLEIVVNKKNNKFFSFHP